jgi:hypothetical protein
MMMMMNIMELVRFKFNEKFLTGENMYVRIEAVCRLTPSLKHYNRPAHLSRSFDTHET